MFPKSDGTSQEAPDHFALSAEDRWLLIASAATLQEVAPGLRPQLDALLRRLEAPGAMSTSSAPPPVDDRLRPLLRDAIRRYLAHSPELAPEARGALLGYFQSLVDGAVDPFARRVTITQPDGSYMVLRARTDAEYRALLARLGDLVAGGEQP